MLLVRTFLLAFILILCSSCAGKSGDEPRYVYVSESDIADGRLARIDGGHDEDCLSRRMPDAEFVTFKNASEFIVALNVGKCDAGIADRKDAEILLAVCDELRLLNPDTAETDDFYIIVHKRKLPGGSADSTGQGLFEKTMYRIERSLLSDSYWLLICRGLLNTVIIFVFGLLLSLILAVSMVYLEYQPRMRKVFDLLHYIVKTIRDLPSIVLIFFFYYVVFASVPVSGIIVCIISLGVYFTKAFYDIFTVHLSLIDPRQHQAAHMLGLTGWKKYRLIILPQAVKPMLPLLSATSKSLLRSTSYAGYIAQLDLIKVTEIIRNQTYEVLVPLLLVSIIFLLLSWAIREGIFKLYSIVFAND